MHQDERNGEFVVVLGVAVLESAMDGPEVRKEWTERSGEYSPAYYAHYGPNGTSELLRERLDASVGPSATVLELGCSSGRHLAHLAAHGYDDLHGIDINADALGVMAETYPDLAEDGTFHIDAIEDVLPRFEDGTFDAVFSVETLQHIHPESEWVFADCRRITTDCLITVENEGERSTEETEPAVNYVREEFPLYYRNWADVFCDLGLQQVESKALDRDTFRMFRCRDTAPDRR